MTKIPHLIKRNPDWIVAILLTLAAIWLHVLFLTHAGGLWRDEVAVTNISRLPTMGQVWKAMPHDHCPIVFLSLVRFWTMTGLGATDAGLRLLGVGCGLLLLAAFWGANRMMGQGLPLLSLALAGLNFTIIRYGDSIRAYGLATACILLTMALVWRFIEVPKLSRGLMAGVAAVLSVQVLYQNSFFLLAICIAGVAVCFRRNEYRNALAVLGMGAAAAVSLLPYVSPLYHAQSWWMVNKTGITWAIFSDRIIRGTGSLAGVWLILPIVTILFGAGYAFSKVPRKETDMREHLPMFACIALAVGLVGFGCFIKLSGLPTQTWYYVPAMGFAVVCCDIILPRVHRVARSVVLVMAIVIAGLAIRPALANLKQRQTNGDLVAAEVSKEAKPGDLVIVHPWYNGLTFAYYYRGEAPWTTLPPLADYRFHRYDLLKSKLQATNAIEPVLKRVESILSSGHRVWLVGQIPPPKSGAPPVELPPAPYGPKGWADQPYSDAWGEQLSYFLAHHITNATPLPAVTTNLVSPMEDMEVIRASGWRPLAKRAQTGP